MTKKAFYFQDVIMGLQKFWGNYGCCILQPYDMEVGAGTFHPATFLKCLGPNPWKAAYVQPSRRPTDGRYAKNPMRTQHYYQYQVIVKPIPDNILDVYLDSLKYLGINTADHDLKLVEDDWESPTLGAWGLGWEVWLDSMEVTQFTYFQQAGGIDLNPRSAEITYGLERITMFLQKCYNMFDLKWTKEFSYGDVHRKEEEEFSSYNFEFADINFYKNSFIEYEKQADLLLEKELVSVAYEKVLKMSHSFNMLDARGAVSVTQRPDYILRVRKMAKKCAELYLKSGCV